MKILIVGGGIGGLSLAAFLEKSSIEYELVEKLPAYARQGFLIGLWDNGRDILKKLGLAEQFDASGTLIDTYSFRNGAGRLIRDYDLSWFKREYGTSLRVVERASLHAWLLSKVNKNMVHMGRTVKSIVEGRSAVRVIFDDNTVAQYDAIVGADGVNSCVRNIVFKNTGRFLEWRVWYAWIDKKYSERTIMIEYIEPGELALVVGTLNRAFISLFAPATHTVWDHPLGRIKRLKEMFKDEPVIIEALQNLSDESVEPSDLKEVEMGRWVTRRVALLGDAAHSFGPFAGLGGSMAMEDAYVLAARLQQVSETHSLPKALRDYEATRRKRVRVAKRASQKIKWFSLTTSPFVRSTANMVARYLPASYFISDHNHLMREEI